MAKNKNKYKGIGIVLLIYFILRFLMLISITKPLLQADISIIPISLDYLIGVLAILFSVFVILGKRWSLSAIIAIVVLEIVTAIFFRGRMTSIIIDCLLLILLLGKYFGSSDKKEDVHKEIMKEVKEEIKHEKR